MWKIVAVTLTDENGYFEFRNVPPGTYKVTLDVPGLKHYDPETFDLDEGDSIIDIEYEVTEDSIINKSGEEVGIWELRNDKVTKLHVYPNPANYELRITNYEFKDGEVIEIYNVAGQKVYQINNLTNQQQITKSTNNQINNIIIDVSHLAKGLYFLKINNQVTKFIKE